MRWLKSTTQKRWTVNGKTIPACDTSNNAYLQLEENEYSIVSKMPVIASLIKAGGILVLNEEPAELRNSVDALQGSNASLMAKNKALEDEIQQLKASQPEPVDVEAIKQAAIAELKEEALAELAKKDEEIASLNKEISDLNKQLKKAKKASDSVEE